jgi:hypothetical protein
MDILATILLMGLVIAAAAYVYAVVLQMPGEILGWVPGRLNRLPTYIAKPLFTCQKCVAGQLSLWLFPFLIENYQFSFQVIVFHVFQITTSIFFAVVITKLVGDPRTPVRSKPVWTPPEISN